MKTQKEKAEELVMTFLRLQEDGSSNWFHKNLAKKCGLIAVDMSIEEIDNFNRHGGFQYRIEYLQEVKTEIEKL